MVRCFCPSWRAILGPSWPLGSGRPLCRTWSSRSTILAAPWPGVDSWKPKDPTLIPTLSNPMCSPEQVGRKRFKTQPLGLWTPKYTDFDVETERWGKKITGSVAHSGCNWDREGFKKWSEWTTEDFHYHEDGIWWEPTGKVTGMWKMTKEFGCLAFRFCICNPIRWKWRFAMSKNPGGDGSHEHQKFGTDAGDCASWPCSGILSGTWNCLRLVWLVHHDSCFN